MTDCHKPLTADAAPVNGGDKGSVSIGVTEALTAPMILKELLRKRIGRIHAPPQARQFIQPFRTCFTLAETALSASF